MDLASAILRNYLHSRVHEQGATKAQLGIEDYLAFAKVRAHGSPKHPETLLDDVPVPGVLEFMKGIVEEGMYFVLSERAPKLSLALANGSIELPTLLDVVARPAAAAVLDAHAVIIRRRLLTRRWDRLAVRQPTEELAS